MTCLFDHIRPLAMPFSMQKPSQPSSVVKECVNGKWVCWEIELSSFYTYRFTVIMMTKNKMNRYKGYKKKQCSHALSRSSLIRLIICSIIRKLLGYFCSSLRKCKSRTSHRA